MNEETERTALLLLEVMRRVQLAVADESPEAKPYLDADAVRVDPSVPGGCVFHKDRFLKVLSEQVALERIGNAG